jgi:hypothetical protein
MTIFSVLNQIKSGEVVLPAIQRDFVWSADRVLTLLDSIMRGYPVGIALLWETYENIQYRKFTDNFRSGDAQNFSENSQRHKLKIVLDGQQRLQSLYIALYGKLENEALYFDVLSGIDFDELSEDKYIFAFIDAEEVKSLDSHSEGKQKKQFIKVSDLFSMKAVDQQRLKRKLASELDLSDGDQLRMELNISRFNEAFAKDENILQFSTVDENLPKDSADRKTEADVLEIFVRINRQGTALSRSDLVFSLLKLNWKEAAETLPEFVVAVNKGNSLEIDNDFVIRCLLAVSELGTKFDLEQLRNKQKIDKLRNNFAECCDAIRAAVDFVTRDCKCHSSRVIGGLNTVVPFVFYLFHTKKHEIKNSQLATVKKAFYLLAFARPLSRYGDSRLWAFIKNELIPLARSEDESFPFKRLMYRVKLWERIDSFGEEFLQANPVLTLHILQGLAGGNVQYVRNEPQIDHIFPRAQLRKRDFPDGEINHFANFWILAAGKNQNKKDKPPSDYFSDVNPTILKKALIDRDLLEYRSYRRFLRERKEAMIERVKVELDFSDADFQSVSEV